MRIFAVISYFFVIIIFVISCTNDTLTYEKLEQKLDSLATDSLSENEMVAYTLPSPLQVASVVKMLDIDYKEYYIEDIKNHKFNYTSRADRAICLGFNIIDMGYVAINEQAQPTLTYIAKVEAILQNLGMQSQKDVELFLRIRDNVEDKDSLISVIREYQNNVGEYLKASQESNLSFIIIAGMYIEGLHIACTVYDEQIRDNTLSHFHEGILNQLLFQQKVVCSNIIELLENYNDRKLKPLISQMEELEDSFESLQISYKINNDTHKISKVYLNLTQISSLTNTVHSIRNSILDKNLLK